MLRTDGSGGASLDGDATRLMSSPRWQCDESISNDFDNSPMIRHERVCVKEAYGSGDLARVRRSGERARRAAELCEISTKARN